MSSSSNRSYQVKMSRTARLSRIVLHPFGMLVRRFIHRVISLHPAAVAFWVAESPVIFAAMATLSRLRVFDQLRNGPQTAEELARSVKADEDALLRLLRAVSAVGLLKRCSDGRFALNSVAKQFCSDSLNPLGTWSELVLEMLPLAPHLPEAVRVGQPMVKHATQKTCWEYLETVPLGTELHDRAMSAWTELIVDKVASRYDFSNARTIVDVGGGRGAFLAACLRAAPHLNGTVYDRENTRTESQELFRRHGLSDRAQHASGDFFETVPPGADLYSIKHVLHDWDDENALKILSNIRDGIPTHGRLLIVEGAVDHELLPVASVRAVWDLTQWMSTWGKERTLGQFQDLLLAARFRLENVIITPTIDALILEAAPI